jgi:hypothetical protein
LSRIFALSKQSQRRTHPKPNLKQTRNQRRKIQMHKVICRHRSGLAIRSIQPTWIFLRAKETGKWKQPERLARLFPLEVTTITVIYTPTEDDLAVRSM